MAIVTATLVVNFGDEQEQPGELQLIIDDRPSGLNGGQTSGFSAGDNVYILRLKTSSVTILSQDTTAGSLASSGTGVYDVVDEIVAFNDTRTARLSKPFSSSLSYQWLGNSLGVPSVQNDIELVVPTKGFGNLLVSYSSNYNAYRLHSVATGIPVVTVWSQGEIT